MGDHVGILDRSLSSNSSSSAVAEEEEPSSAIKYCFIPFAARWPVHHAPIVVPYQDSAVASPANMIRPTGLPSVDESFEKLLPIVGWL